MSWRDRRDSLISGVRAPSTLRAPTAPAPRAPSVAMQRSNYTVPTQGQQENVDANQALVIGYYANMYSYRCVQTIAQTIAGLPFVAGADPGQRNAVAPDAPIARLLGKYRSPAPGITSRQLWYWSIVQYLVTGRYSWELTGSKDDPTSVAAVWPLPVRFLKPVPSAAGSLYPWDGFVWNNGMPGGKRNLTPAQVHYAWRPSQDDWRQAESPVQAMASALKLNRSMDIYMDSFMRNNMAATTLVTTPPFAEEDKRRAFQDQFFSSMTGESNAGKTLFAEVAGQGEGVNSSIQVDKIGVSARDGQWLEIRNAIRDQVCEGWGVPRSILGNASERTYENADQEHRNYWTGSVVNWISELDDGINVSLSPRLGTEVGWFDLRGVAALRPARTFAPEPGTALVTAGIVAPNEIRADMGLSPLPGSPVMADPIPLPSPDDTPGAGGGGFGAGGRSVTEAGDSGASNLLPVGSKTPKAASRHIFTAKMHDPKHCAICGGSVTASVHTGTGAPRRGARPKALRHATRHAGASHLSVQSGHAKPGTPEHRLGMFRSWDSATRGVEASLESDMRALFEKQKRATLSRLKGNRGRQMLRAATAAAAESPEPGRPLPSEPPSPQIDPARIFDTGFWATKTAAAIRTRFNDISRNIPDHMRKMISIPDEIHRPAENTMQRLLAERANRIAGNITNTTYRNIQTALMRGINEGEGISALAKRITEVFDEAGTSRARTIARTEVLGAANHASYTYMDALPEDVVDRKEWLATPDHRTRLHHVEASGQIVARDEFFSVGDVKMAFPGDPAGGPSETINCRCTFLPLPPASATASTG